MITVYVDEYSDNACKTVNNRSYYCHLFYLFTMVCTHYIFSSLLRIFFFLLSVLHAAMPLLCLSSLLPPTGSFCNYRCPPLYHAIFYFSSVLIVVPTLPIRTNSVCLSGTSYTLSTYSRTPTQAGLPPLVFNTLVTGYYNSQSDCTTSGVAPVVITSIPVGTTTGIGAGVSSCSTTIGSCTALANGVQLTSAPLYGYTTYAPVSVFSPYTPFATQVTNLYHTLFFLYVYLYIFEPCLKFIWMWYPFRM